MWGDGGGRNLQFRHELCALQNPSTSQIPLPGLTFNLMRLRIFNRGVNRAAGKLPFVA
jgi:hypothetical protein